MQARHNIPQQNLLQLLKAVQEGIYQEPRRDNTLNPKPNRASQGHELPGLGVGVGASGFKVCNVGVSEIRGTLFEVLKIRNKDPTT